MVLGAKLAGGVDSVNILCIQYATIQCIMSVGSILTVEGEGK